MPTAHATTHVPVTGLMLRVEFDAAHRALTACTEELHQVLAQQKPDRARLTSVRLKLAQLRLVHGPLIGKIAVFIATQCTPAQTEKLTELRISHEKLLQDAAAHTGRWTLGAIEANWPEYRQAARELLRRSMHKMQMDQRLLYPLLGARLSSAEPISAKP